MKRYIRKKYRPHYVKVENVRLCMTHYLITRDECCAAGTHSPLIPCGRLMDLFIDVNPQTRGGHAKVRMYGMFYCTTHDQTSILMDECVGNNRFHKFLNDNPVQCNVVALYREPMTYEQKETKMRVAL